MLYLIHQDDDVTSLSLPMNSIPLEILPELLKNGISYKRETLNPEPHTFSHVKYPGPRRSPCEPIAALLRSDLRG